VVRFSDGDANASFSGTITETTYGSAQYAWHAHGALSYAQPNEPPSSERKPASATYLLPAQSITILRGGISPSNETSS
jgi:hypothetical protein